MSKVNKEWLVFRLFSVISVLIVFFAVYKTEFLPDLYEFGIITASLILLAFVFLKKSKLLHVIFIIVLMIPSVGMLCFNRLMHQIVDTKMVETEMLSVVSLAKNKYSVADITVNTVIAVSGITVEDAFEQIRNDVKTKLNFDSTYVVTASDIETIESLYKELYEVGIIDNALIDSYIESFPDFLSDFKILWSFERKIIREDIVKDVNAGDEPFVVLISGIDRDGPITMRARSDVNILLVIHPRTHRITMISIPRDLYVPLSCKSNHLDKLTHSGIYGINCTVQTIENFLDMDINYYVRLNFTSFTEIIDVIGDIQVFSDYSFDSNGFRFIRGVNVLNSESALVFARNRKSFESGDVQRGLNQQEVIKGVINKLISPTNIVNVNRIIPVILHSVETNMDAASLEALVALQIERRVKWEFDSYFVDGNGAFGETFSIPGRDLYIFLADPDSLAEIKDIIASAKAD